MTTCTKETRKLQLKYSHYSLLCDLKKQIINSKYLFIVNNYSIYFLVQLYLLL